VGPAARPSNPSKIFGGLQTAPVAIGKTSFVTAGNGSRVKVTYRLLDPCFILGLIRSPLLNSI
jgi:hypothetical protein